MTFSFPPIAAKVRLSVLSGDCLEIDRFPTGAWLSSPSKEYRDRRGLLRAQRRLEGFHQKPHVEKADRQLTAIGAADAGMKVSIQARLRSAGGPADRSRRSPACSDVTGRQISPGIRQETRTCRAPVESSALP